MEFHTTSWNKAETEVHLKTIRRSKWAGFCFNINQTRIDAKVMRCLLEWWCKLITWQRTLMILCIVDFFFYTSKFLPSLHFHDHRAADDLSSINTLLFWPLCAPNVRNPNNLHRMSYESTGKTNWGTHQTVLPQHSPCRQKDGVEKPCCFTAWNRVGLGVNSVPVMKT